MKITGVVIAGGISKRMGTDKLAISFQGQTLLQRAISLLEKFSENVLISSNQNIDSRYPIVTDIYTNIGPISGIYSALKQSTTQKILILPVDMPLLSKKILDYLFENIQNDALINIFSTNSKTQMLVGIYDKKLIPIIKEQIDQKNYKLRELLKSTTVNIIDGSKFEEYFINTNTPEEWQNLLSKHER